MGFSSAHSVIPFAGTPAPTQKPAAGVLSSWKDISAYLSRGVRTAQRWELELGLPVHRMSTANRAPVFAYEHEIDAWLRERASTVGLTSVRRSPANSRQQSLVECVHELCQSALELEEGVTAEVSTSNAYIADALDAVLNMTNALLKIQKALNAALAQNQLSPAETDAGELGGGANSQAERARGLVSLSRPTSPTRVRRLSFN